MSFLQNGTENLTEYSDLSILTKTPGNAAWENPPQYVNVNEAAEYIWEKLHEEKFLEQVVSFLASDIPIEAIARMILFGGFVAGSIAFIIGEKNGQ